MRTLPIIALLFLAAGCGGEDSNKVVDGPGDPPTNRFATPKDAVNTFFEAAEHKDKKLLSQCFSKDAEGEFKSLVDMSVSDKMLGELADMFKGATIDGIEDEGDHGHVKVKLPNFKRGKETLNLVKEGDSWKIQGF